MGFQFNDRVVVDGRQGRFIEYTPNGSARVFLNERDDLLVDTESLSRPRSVCTLPLDDDEIFYEELQTEYESYIERQDSRINWESYWAAEDMAKAKV